MTNLRNFSEVLDDLAIAFDDLFLNIESDLPSGLRCVLDLALI
jgi:hypothetical protein